VDIIGAGIWYTTLYFNKPGEFGGGIVGFGSHIHLQGFSVNTTNDRRRNGTGYMNYKGAVLFFFFHFLFLFFFKVFVNLLGVIR
jgi:hypothetical protein